ncbi:MAG: patatin-like phospholipase family protein [Steroidobacteraceae bacterium]
MIVSAPCYRPPPVDAQEERTQVDPTANPWAMLASLPLFSGLPTTIIDAAVAELEWISVPGGGLLFEAGAPADSVYFVVSGCLGAFGPGGDLVGRIAAGESVGEMGLIVARPRAATVRALRDSELARLSSGTFERVLLSHPEAILRLARLSVARLLDNAPPRGAAPAAPRTITIIPHDPTIDVAALAAALVQALGRLGRVDLVGSARAARHSGQWFHEVESRNDFVVYAGESADTAWTQLCVRQADVLLLAARASDECGSWHVLDRHVHAAQRAELVLLHEGGIVAGAATRWRQTLPGAPCHHLRGPADMARIVRLMTHRAVGLVLSGGGARGFAHLGVVRALREHGVPIDLVGGTSMGGILAAGVAADWTDDELFERFRRSFVETNPLSDFTLPLVSLVSGRKVGQLLRRELGDIDIEDLPLPFFCVSSNLTSGRVAVHRQGPLWRWLRASVAIPGVLPPVFYGGEVYVDGGTMNNLPVDVMRALGRGPVIGVDVGTDRTFTTDIEATEAPSLWNLFRRQHGRRRRPNILQILWRSGMVNSTTATQDRRGQSDLLLMPPLESLDLLDWKSFERAIDIGYRHTGERLASGALDQLKALFS